MRSNNQHMTANTAAFVGSQTDLGLLSPQPDRWPSIENYRPLDTNRREIRLLRIKKLSGEVHASLEHVSLDDDPEYDALSYCWGPPSARRSIFIDGNPVLISKTVVIFLEALCKHGQQLPIWMDLICIHQADLAERNAQVAIMGDIYRAAVSVRAWLGTSDVDIEYSLAYVNASSESDIRENPKYRKLAQEGLRQISQRPYWRRMWIVQEIGLARVMHVYCGDDKVGFMDLCTAIADSCPNPDVEVVQELHRTLRGNAYRESSMTKNILDQIRIFSARQCQDSRDRVYAMRSLAIGGHNIEVDYEKDIHEVALGAIENYATISSPTDTEHVSRMLQAAAGLVNVLELSAEKLVSSISNPGRPLVTATQTLWCDQRRIDCHERLTTAFHNHRLAKDTSHVTYGRDGNVSEYHISAEYDCTNARWTFKNAYLSKYIVQVNDGRPKIAGILVEFDESDDWTERRLPHELEEVEEWSRIELSLIMHGHIQCCPIPPARSCGVRMHYSWYAFLVLACLPLVKVDEAWGILYQHLVDVAAESLCDCEQQESDIKFDLPAHEEQHPKSSL